MGKIIYIIKMKYTLAIAALLGAMSVEQTSAVSVAYPRNTQYVQESESDSESSDEEMVQTAGDFFEARENGTGHLDKKYERVAPEHFSTGSDDLFMKSMIMNYSQEPGLITTSTRPV